MADRVGRSATFWSDRPTTGAELVNLIEREALRRGVGVVRFAAPLSPHPDSWLRQLAVARRPKPATVARIEALIAAEAVAPPPPNHFQARLGPRREPMHRAGGDIAPERLPPRVDRDPCPRCGTRGDLGCGHRRPQPTIGAAL